MVDWHPHLRDVWSMGESTRTNIEPATTDFIGRGKELRTLLELLREGRRLVTMLGMAGTGKTRLSRELGRACTDRFDGGVWFCDLSQARSRSDVVASVCAALDMEPPASEASLQERSRRVGERIAAAGEVLIILDNFEQVADSSADLLVDWLEWTNDAQFLVTSRQRLRLASEYCLDLSPLAPADAIELFESRAQMAIHDFRVTPEIEGTIRQLVSHLDHLPLAIELAAARIRTFPPEELLDRLSSRFRLLRSPHRDRDRRQATMKEAITWSWEMLAAAERTTLGQLTVFEGGWTAEMAEDIVDLSDIEGDPWVLDVIESLVDKSLLKREGRTDDGQPGRFIMYESIRDFVRAERDPLDNGWDVVERHARSVARRAEALIDELETGSPGAALARLRSERPNLMAAFERTRERRPALAFRLASSLQSFLRYGGSSEQHREVVDFMTTYAKRRSQQSSEVSTCQARAELRAVRGDLESAIDDLQRALDLTAHVSRPGTRAELLAKTAGLERRAGDWSAAETHLDEARDILVEAELSDLRRDIYTRTACLAVDRRRRQQALESLEQARSIPAGDHNRMACANLNRMAYIHDRLGNFERARALAEQARPLAEEIGDKRLEGLSLQHVGLARLGRGLFDEAADRFQRALNLHRKHGQPYAGAVALARLARARHLSGEDDEAMQSYGQARRMFRKIQARPCRARLAFGLGALRFGRGDFETALDLFDEAGSEYRAIGDRFGEVRVRVAAAWAELGAGDIERGVSSLRELASLDSVFAPVASATLSAAGDPTLDADDISSAIRRALDDEVTATSRPLECVLRTFQSMFAAEEGDRPTSEQLQSSVFGRMAQQLLDAEVLSDIDVAAESSAGASGAGLDGQPLVIGPGAKWFRLAGGEPVDLRRRGSIRRVLNALAGELESGGPDALDVYDLFEAGWPDEEIAPDQASNRVYWAIREIRDLGFEELLVTSDDGYYLDPGKMSVRRSTEKPDM